MFPSEQIIKRIGRYDSFVQSINFYNKLAVQEPHFDLPYFEVLGIDYSGSNYRMRLKGEANHNGDPLR